MTVIVPCTNPDKCGVNSHISGSVAAAQCGASVLPTANSVVPRATVDSFLTTPTQAKAPSTICSVCEDDLTEDDIKVRDGLCEECYGEDLDRREYEELSSDKKHSWSNGYYTKYGSSTIEGSDPYTECDPKGAEEEEWDRKLREYDRQGIEPNTTFWTQDDKDALEGARVRSLGVSVNEYQDATQKYDPDF